jgi:hypothetical protein
MQNPKLTGKIEAIEPVGEIQSKYGTLNKYRVTFESGDILSFNAKGEFKKRVGDEVTYEKDVKYGNGKLIYDKPQSFQPKKSNEDTQTYIIRQSMLKAAIDYHADNRSKTEHQIVETAKYFVNYVTNG